MKKGNRVVFGIFDDRLALEKAVGDLKGAGFRSADISVLMPQGDSLTIGHEKATKAPEGASIGGGTGALLGGALGWLVGAGTIAVAPALAPFVAVGPILAALAGMGAGSAVGGLTGALVGFGLPEYEAKRYEGIIHQGGTLLSVHADDQKWADKAKDILQESGAHDVAASTEEASTVASQVNIDATNDQTSNY